MSEDDLREEMSDDTGPGRTRFARACWLSPRDCREVHRKAAPVDLPENPVTVNAASRNDEPRSGECRGPEVMMSLR